MALALFKQLSKYFICRHVLLYITGELNRKRRGNLWELVIFMMGLKLLNMLLAGQVCTEYLVTITVQILFSMYCHISCIVGRNVKHPYFTYFSFISLQSFGWILNRKQLKEGKSIFLALSLELDFIENTMKIWIWKWMEEDNRSMMTWICLFCFPLPPPPTTISMISQACI